MFAPISLVCQKHMGYWRMLISGQEEESKEISFRMKIAMSFDFFKCKVKSITNNDLRAV